MTKMITLLRPKVSRAEGFGLAPTKPLDLMLRAEMSKARGTSEGQDIIKGYPFACVVFSATRAHVISH